MIKDEQEKYLASRPDRIVTISPFDPKVKETGEAMVRELQVLVPDLKIYFWGAAALGLAGQNDIDINIFSTPSDYGKYRPALEKVLGPPSRITRSVKWELKRNGFDIEIYLTDQNAPATQEQLKVFEILSENKELRDEYEKTKLPYGEIDYKIYMRKKYEFFNRILGLE
jgi:GrpB-like predicted nucleotidyltransferase (UPF0157 family)